MKLLIIICLTFCCQFVVTLHYWNEWVIVNCTIWPLDKANQVHKLNLCLSALETGIKMSLWRAFLAWFGLLSCSMMLYITKGVIIIRKSEDRQYNDLSAKEQTTIYKIYTYNETSNHTKKNRGWATYPLDNANPVHITNTWFICMSWG